MKVQDTDLQKLFNTLRYTIRSSIKVGKFLTKEQVDFLIQSVENTLKVQLVNLPVEEAKTVSESPIDMKQLTELVTKLDKFRENTGMKSEYKQEYNTTLDALQSYVQL